MNLVFIFAAFSWQNSINYKVMGWTFQGLKTEFCVFNTSHSAHELHGRLLLDMSVLHHSSVHLFTVLKYLHQSLKPRSDLHVSRRRCFSSFTAAEHEGTQSLQLKCKSAPSLLKKKPKKHFLLLEGISCSTETELPGFSLWNFPPEQSERPTSPDQLLMNSCVCSHLWRRDTQPPYIWVMILETLRLSLRLR